MEEDPNKKKQWSLDRVVPKKYKIGYGMDSTVYRVINSSKKIEAVVKDYHNENITPEKLKDYYSDTERARKILLENPNPLNQTIQISGETFTLEYEVLDQGGILLKENIVGEPEIPYNGKGCVFGQRFISGENLVLLGTKKYDKSPTQPNQKILSEKEDLQVLIYTRTKDLFRHISNRIGRDFTFYSSNIKPFLDPENKKIKVYITDLAGSILESYPD